MSERASEGELQAVGPRWDCLLRFLWMRRHLSAAKHWPSSWQQSMAFSQVQLGAVRQRETSKTGDGKSWIEPGHVLSIKYEKIAWKQLRLKRRGR